MFSFTSFRSKLKSHYDPTRGWLRKSPTVFTCFGSSRLNQLKKPESFFGSLVGGFGSGYGSRTSAVFAQKRLLDFFMRSQVELLLREYELLGCLLDHGIFQLGSQDDFLLALLA